MKKKKQMNDIKNMIKYENIYVSRGNNRSKTKQDKEICSNKFDSAKINKKRKS
jgi:hypothetical protein